MDKPLAGKKVLVTRSREQAGGFSAKLKASGAVPLVVPLLTFQKRKNKENDKRIRQLHDFTWVFFTSANGVKFFFDYVQEIGIPAVFLKKVKFAVVGEKTEKALQRFGYSASFKPARYQARAMAGEFLQKKQRKDDCILLVCGNLSRGELAAELQMQQLTVEKVVLYDTIHNMAIKHQLLYLLEECAIDAYTFTSPSTVRAFVKLTEDNPRLVQVIKDTCLCVCIGTTTETEARKSGFRQIRIPGRFTIEGMVQEMKKYFAEKG